ncbi:hypothetical protein [Providencia manganoxydans]|uniref:hypothetical protein n=1 Tax=Providencia manganoxydans TaxID=2923283 RepID=UPI00280DFC63|nr:hypothetical protein [Providencia stuartii]ELR5081163.1 hypothetical protein [Providencia stuartii]
MKQKTMFDYKLNNMIKTLCCAVTVVFSSLVNAQENNIEKDKNYISLNEKSQLSKLWLAYSSLNDDSLLNILSKNNYKENNSISKLVIKQYELNKIKKILSPFKDNQYYSLQIDEPVFVRDDLAYTVRKILNYNDKSKVFNLEITPCGGMDKLKEIRASKGMSLFIKNEIFCDFPVDDPELVKKIEDIKSSRRFDLSFGGKIYMRVSMINEKLIGEVEDVDFSIYDRKNKEIIYKWNYITKSQ